MNRLIRSIFLLVFLSASQNLQAYDFSAISPSGHTLYYTISNGTASVVSPLEPGWYYIRDRGITGDIVIPDTVSYNNITYSVTSIGPSTFSHCESVRSITIPSSVTNIGESAFDCCYKLSTLYIPDAVTNIGIGAFDGVKHIVYYGTATGSPWSARYMNGYVETPLVFEDSTKSSLWSCDPLTASVTIPNSVISINDY